MEEKFTRTDQRPINLLQPQNYPLSTPPKTKTKRVIFLLLALAILGLLIFRNYTMVKWPSNPAAYDPVTLKPKRIGFLHTVKNFIFSS